LKEKRSSLFTYIGRDDAWDDEDVEDSLPMGNPLKSYLRQTKILGKVMVN
jgi:hypothetical protein